MKRLVAKRATTVRAATMLAVTLMAGTTALASSAVAASSAAGARPAAAPSTAGARPAGTSSAPASSPRIATYNVFLLPRALYPNWGQLQRADLIDRANVLAGQDVVVLNEMFDNEASNRLAANLADSYPHQTPVVGRTTSGWDSTEGAYSSTSVEDGGVMVLSRWPITRKVQHVYSQACGVEVASNKGFAYVRLSSPSGPVHVIGTHLQAQDGSCSVDPAQVRASQMAELAAFVAAAQIPAGEPLYIAGDLNVIRDSPEYPRMLAALGVQAPQFAGHRYSWDCNDNSVCQGQYGDSYASEHLDYVLPVLGHPAPRSFVDETRRVKSPTWTVWSWFTPYSYNDFSDHYPVFGYAG